MIRGSVFRLTAAKIAAALGYTPAESGGGGSSSSGSAGAVQTSDGAGGFDDIGTLSAALAALGVGPGEARLIGPYTVLFSDVPHDQDTKALCTPTAGDILFGIFARLVTPWDAGEFGADAVITIYDGDPSIGNSYGGPMSLTASVVVSANGAIPMTSAAFSASLEAYADQLPAELGGAALTAGVSGYGGGAAIAGEARIYFLLATPAPL